MFQGCITKASKVQDQFADKLASSPKSSIFSQIAWHKRCQNVSNLKKLNSTKLTFKTPGWSRQSSSSPRRASRRTFELWCCKCANNSLRPNLRADSGTILRRCRWRWVSRILDFHWSFGIGFLLKKKKKYPKRPHPGGLHWKTCYCHNFLGIRMKMKKSGWNLKGILYGCLLHPIRGNVWQSISDPRLCIVVYIYIYISRHAQMRII